MQLSTGAEFITAVTNLINALVTVILMIRMPKLPGSRMRICLWEVSHAFFLIVCMLGTLVHWFVWPKEYNRLIWNVLFTVLAFMITSFMTCIFYETKGPSWVRPSAAASIILAVGFAVVKNVIMHGGGFIVFTVFSGTIIVFLLIFLMLCAKQKPYLKWFIAGLLFLTVGSVIQGMRAIRFHFLVDINHNVVYHLFTLVFVFLTYKGITEAAKKDIWRGL